MADNEHDINVVVHGANNRIMIDEHNGVVTQFAGVQETYSLTDDEASNLKELLTKYEAHATSEHGGLLNYIPAPKIIDLSVAMTRDDLFFKNPCEIEDKIAEGKVVKEEDVARDFLDIKEEFSSNLNYIGQYSTMYSIGVENTGDQYKEPNADIEALKQEMDRIKGMMEGDGYKLIQGAEDSISSAIKETMKAIGTGEVPAGIIDVIGPETSQRLYAPSA